MNGSSSGAFPNISINVSVTGGGVGVVLGGNYPPWANATWQTCRSSNQCIIVPVTYCQNGAPQQSTCVNSQYQSQYLSAFNTSVTKQKFCPLYIIAVQKSCVCIQKTCTLVIGGGS